MNRKSIPLALVCGVGVGASADPIEDLPGYLANKREGRPAISAQTFYQLPLTKAQAASARDLLWKDQVEVVTRTEKAAWDAGKFSLNGYDMAFKFKVFGSQPASGRSLFLSMHGGGSTTADVNDEQWANQQVLYTPAEGVYLSPRAPTDSWNMWHQSHIDSLFARIIQAAVVFRSVDPNRVYVMGYSAGGDGAYQLAPRMADRWAAAAMMAGHPNDASPLSLRNIGMTLHVGALDNAYDRNLLVPRWGKTLDSLRALDPGGYANFAQVHAGKPHWMDREDTVAVSWMRTFTRNPRPERVVWKQDDVMHERFYWLGAVPSQVRKASLVVATRSGQDFRIESSDLDTVRIFLDDSLADLDRPVQVQWKSGAKVQITPVRTVRDLWESMLSKTDKNYMFSASLKAHAGMVSGIGSDPSRFARTGYRAYLAGGSRRIRYEQPHSEGLSAEIAVLDQRGVRIWHGRCDAASGTLELDLPTSGVYFVRWATAGSSVTMPIAFTGK